jgi:hypothetical protein
MGAVLVPLKETCAFLDPLLAATREAVPPGKSSLL